MDAFIRVVILLYFARIRKDARAIDIQQRLLSRARLLAPKILGFLEL
jgi:hypothetical protein